MRLYKNIDISLRYLSAARGKGGHPLASPRQRTQRTKAPKNLLSCANQPYIVRTGLMAAAHAASDQAHVPRDRRIARVGRTRPVVERLHADKGVPTRPTGSFPTRLTEQD